MTNQTYDVLGATTYLREGGLGETVGLISMAMAIGGHKVQMDADHAMALTELAGHGLDCERIDIGAIREATAWAALAVKNMTALEKALGVQIPDAMVFGGVPVADLSGSLNLTAGDIRAMAAVFQAAGDGAAVARAAEKQSAGDWKWWAGSSEEIYKIGPHDTREDALNEALASECFHEAVDGNGVKSLGVYIVEARLLPLRIADWIEADDAPEVASISYGESPGLAECDEGPWFECSKEQAQELALALKQAANNWQDKHGLIFMGSTFTDQRNAEYVPQPAMGPLWKGLPHERRP